MGLLNILFTKRYSYIEIRILPRKALNFRMFVAPQNGRVEGWQAGGTSVIIRLHKYFLGFNVEADQDCEGFSLTLRSTSTYRKHKNECYKQT